MNKLTVVLLFFCSCSSKGTEIPKQKILAIDSINNYQQKAILIEDTVKNQRFHCLPWKTKAKGNRIYFYDSLHKLLQVEEWHSDGTLNEFCRIHLIDNKVSVIEMEGHIADLKTQYMILDYFEDGKRLFNIETHDKIKDKSCIDLLNLIFKVKSVTKE